MEKNIYFVGSYTLLRPKPIECVRREDESWNSRKLIERRRLRVHLERLHTCSVHKIRPGTCIIAKVYTDGGWGTVKKMKRKYTMTDKFTFSWHFHFSIFSSVNPRIFRRMHDKCENHKRNFKGSLKALSVIFCVIQ